MLNEDGLYLSKEVVCRIACPQAEAGKFVCVNIGRAIICSLLLVIWLFHFESERVELGIVCLCWLFHTKSRMFFR